MKKLKITLFIIIIFLLSGCSVNYTLEINEDNTINENVEASEITNRLKSYTRLDEEAAVNYLFNIYKRDNEDIKLSHRSDNNKTYAVAYTSHTSIDDSASKFKSDIFNKVSISRNNNVVTLTTKLDKMLNSGESYSTIYDDVTINIKLPYKVLENNADRVNKNVYTWTINENTKEKNIMLSYKENVMKDTVNLKINNKTYNINYGFIVIGGIILLVLIIILVVVIKNKKNNVV